jgi:uncharacterized surface protein with fasciclin (FAS1) repeats
MLLSLHMKGEVVMKRSFRLMLLALATLFLASCVQNPPDPDPATVTEVLRAEGFTTLATAINTAGLDDTLAGEGPFTLFAPTDEAFEALPEGALDALLSDPEMLTEVLNYHVLGEEALAADLTPGFRTTAQGNPLALTAGTRDDEQTVVLNSLARISEPNLEAENGVIHGINYVLSIPEAEFAAVLSGADEAPPVDSNASGSLTATLDGTILTVEGTYEGLVASAAHIHGPATTVDTADVLFPLTFDNETGTLSAIVDLGAEENKAFGPTTFGNLQIGFLYANLHTEENPDGEIRGRLVPADKVILEPDFTALLSGSEEVPPVETDGEGTLQAALNEEGTILTVTGTYTGLSGAPTPPEGATSAVHIHVAPRGENGPIVAPLTVTPDLEADPENPTSGTFGGEVMIGTDEGQLPLEDLEGFGAYVNIHTEANPAGEIRGQLTDVRP